MSAWLVVQPRVLVSVFVCVRAFSYTYYIPKPLRYSLWRGGNAECSSPCTAGGCVVRLPSDCQQIGGDGGFAGSSFFVRYYVDDGVLVEGLFFPDGRRCLRPVQSLATDHFRLLRDRGYSDPPLILPTKVTNFEARLEVLGWVLDTQQLTILTTDRKQHKLSRLLHAWPESRTFATRQVSELTGFLTRVSFALWPCTFFVGRLLAAVGLPKAAVFVSAVLNPSRCLTFGPMIHDDLDSWRWLVQHGFAARGGDLTSPMYNIVVRPPPPYSFFGCLQECDWWLLCANRQLRSV